MASSAGKERTHCIRCGDCCRKSSPTLQMADLPRVKDGFIQRADLYTIRTGEPVRDTIRGGIKETDHECIKIRETSGGCVYFDGSQNACRIYGHRPVQCAAQQCWDEREFMRVYAEPRATRRDLITNPNLLKVIEAHERRCGISEMERWIRRIDHRGETAIAPILKMLRFDHDLREMMPERLRMDPGELDLILGRPLRHIIEGFGLRVLNETNGSFFLTVKNGDASGTSDDIPTPHLRTEIPS